MLYKVHWLQYEQRGGRSLSSSIGMLCVRSIGGLLFRCKWLCVCPALCWSRGVEENLVCPSSDSFLKTASTALTPRPVSLLQYSITPFLRFVFHLAHRLLSQEHRHVAVRFRSRRHSGKGFYGRYVTLPFLKRGCVVPLCFVFEQIVVPVVVGDTLPSLWHGIFFTVSIIGNPVQRL